MEPIKYPVGILVPKPDDTSSFKVSPDDLETEFLGSITCHGKQLIETRAYGNFAFKGFYLSNLFSYKIVQDDTGEAILLVIKK